MIKGVNKRILEVHFPDSDCFEKAVIFLRSDAPPADEKTLAAARTDIGDLEPEIRKLCTFSAGTKLTHLIKRVFDIAAKIAVIICAVCACAWITGLL